MLGLLRQSSWTSTRKLKSACLVFCLLFAIVTVAKAHGSKASTVDEHNHSHGGHADHANSCTADTQRAGASTYNSIWFVGLLSSLVFALVGVLPAFFIQSDADEEAFKNSMMFKMLLAFAAGSLLAEVFLHYIPENSGGTHQQQIEKGLVSIGSFFTFMVIDKLAGMIPNAHALGVLNLVANFFDNGVHGTTIVGAFKSSFWFGSIALIATIIHEVPHEFGDFALLLRDGIPRRTAILLQLATAFAGSIGATVTHIMTTTFETTSTCGGSNHYLESLQAIEPTSTGSFVLCFTTGGFLYIAAVGILPEIIEEKDKKTSLFQLVAFSLGILLIYTLISIETLLPALFL